MTTRTPALILAAAIYAASFVTASADTIELADGRKLSGTVSRQGNQATIKTDDGQTITAAWADIVRVSLSGPADPSAPSSRASPDMAKSDWTRIAAQIKTAPDLAAIITLHQKFLEKYPDSPLTQQAKESLVIYQQLAGQNAIKFHGQWLPPDQIDTLQKQWTQAAQPALDLYNAGKFKDALNSAQAVVTKDNQNSDAITLAGLASYQTNALAVARKYFSDLAQSDPTNVLAQNNLAVISFQQKYADESLTHLAKALQLDPSNPLLLDNAIEVIHSYKQSDADAKAADFRALVDAFTPAEAGMEAEMAKRGLSRIGSTWATKDELSIAAKNAKAVQDQMDQLDARYKANHQKIEDAEQKINQAFADEDTAARAWRATNIVLVNANTRSPEYAAAMAGFNGAQTRWQATDQNTVRQLVRRFDFRVREMTIAASAQKLKAQLDDEEGFLPDNPHMMDKTAQSALAADYSPRRLAAAATKPMDQQPRSTVSKPESDNPDDLVPNGTVKIAYLPLLPGRSSGAGGNWGTPFLLEVPTEQPGTYLSAYGNRRPTGFLGPGESYLLYNTKDWPRYWIDDMKNDAAAPQLMPPEYVGTALGRLNRPSWGFGHRVSDATTVGPVTIRGGWALWSPYAHTQD